MPGSFEKLKPSAAAQAEIVELRARAARLEADLRTEGVPDTHAGPAAAQKAVVEQWQKSVVSPTIVPEQLGAITLQLSPEEHD